MPTDFDSVKERLNLQSVIISETGLSMGRSHLEKCPFCEGHDCFSIPQSGKFQNTFKCHQCGAGGDVFAFLEKYKSIGKAEALSLAANIAGVQIAELAKRKPQRLSKVDQVRQDAAEYFHLVMLENGGKKYLTEDRGHLPETLSRTKTGFTDRKLIQHLQAKGFSQEEIEKSGVGIMKEQPGRRGSFSMVDRWPSGLVIYPHFHQGKVLHFTHKDPKKRKENEWQLRSEYRSKDWRFYNQDALRFNEIIVVEGENDVQTLMDAGLENVLGTIGQPSEEQIKALKAHCLKKHLFLWFDNDGEGKKGGRGFTRRVCEALGEGYQVKVIVSAPSAAWCFL